jgi:hypothetical protein
LNHDGTTEEGEKKANRELRESARINALRNDYSRDARFRHLHFVVSVVPSWFGFEK